MPNPVLKEPSGVYSRAGSNAQVALSLYRNGSLLHILTFPVTPNQITFYVPSRVTMTQTIGGVFNDDFGAGIPIITIQGNTGYWESSRGSFDGSAMVDGYTTYQKIYRIFYLDYFALEGSNLSPSPSIQERLLDTYSGRHFVVKPYQDFQIEQASDDPLNWDYTLTFEILRDLNSPS